MTLQSRVLAERWDRKNPDFQYSHVLTFFLFMFKQDDDVGELEGMDDNDSEGENEDPKPETSKETGNEKSTWEDIYGRTRDSEGNVVKATATKYVPPALRAQAAAAGGKGADAIALAKLSKQVTL